MTPIGQSAASTAKGVGPPFGPRALASPSVDALLRAEEEAGRAGRFADLDRLVGSLLGRQFSGRPLLETRRGEDGEVRLSIAGIGKDQRSVLTNTFGVENQQARGAWYLPEEAALKTGWVNFPAYVHQYPRYAVGIAAEERPKVRLAGCADAVCTWALLEPLSEQLFRPFELRGPVPAKGGREEQRGQWDSAEIALASLGLENHPAMDAMRYGGGWHGLSADQQVRVRSALLKAIGAQVGVTTAAHYRALRVYELIAAYYRRAKGGRALRKQVLTKTVQRSLTCFFGGDWLAFLDYLGEPPHPDERITTGLPETRLFVDGAARAREAAARLGIAPAEAERMLSAYWGQDAAASPVELRTSVLSDYWKLFDELQARQRAGMVPLWGLVEDYRNFRSADSEGDSSGEAPKAYTQGLYRQLLPYSVVKHVEVLWGTRLLPRWPDRLCTEPFPHAAMAETIGPALRFWQGCALTAWFLCEGPYSRTDLKGLAEYHRRDLEALAATDTPVDPALFRELILAEGRLGESKAIYRDAHAAPDVTEVIPGVSLSVSVRISHGSRRDGFEILRDVITRHRRAWTERYWDAYLRARWEREITAASRAFHLALHEKQRAPTARQFAGIAEGAANHWFGGDLRAVYGAIREKSPVQPRYERLLPKDPTELVRAVFETLGGTTTDWEQMLARYSDATVRSQEYQKQRGLQQLAEQSVWYVQLQEAAGRPPTLSEFGRSKFAWLAAALGDDIDAAWISYAQALERVLHGITRVGL